MVNNTIHAVYSETYDLNTAVGELSMLGIHTPQAGTLKRMYHGFFEQYKKFRILGCNLKMVCASQQSLDPSQMGLEAGQVDPRDVLNPILFKACTGEGLNALLDKAYDEAQSNNSIDQITTNTSADIQAYYNLLADESFRKSHPQAGLEVMHLVPKVHKVVSTQPLKYPHDMTLQEVAPPNVAVSPGPSHTYGGSRLPGNDYVLVSNGVTDMPWMDTAEDVGTAVVGQVKYSLITNIPRVFMGVIVLPPAILQRLFFRMTIVWHIEFRDFRPAQDLGTLTSYVRDSGNPLGTNLDSAYFNMYHNPTPSKLGNEVSSFSTTDGTEVQEVLTKAQ